VLADTSQPIGDLRSQYRAAVEYDHPVRGIDVRLNPIVRQDGNYVYRRRAGGEINLNLYALTRAIDEQATKPVPSAFTQDGDQTILELRMNVRTGFEQLLPGEGLIDRLSEIVGNVEKYSGIMLSSTSMLEILWENYEHKKFLSMHFQTSKLSS
jgi:hypothetical protein